MSLSETHGARGTKIMSVLVERIHRLRGFDRRMATLRATGSIALRCVPSFHRSWIGGRTRRILSRADRLRRQRVGDGFGKRRIVVWGVVVDEQDLVGLVGQDLRHAVDAERSPFVQVVAVTVVAPVENNRHHQNSVSRMASQRSRPPGRRGRARPSRISRADVGDRRVLEQAPRVDDGQPSRRDGQGAEGEIAVSRAMAS